MMNDTQQEENSESGTLPSFTDRLLWSDCPEELYLQRILEEQQLEGGGGAEGGDSLLGDSTVENLLVRKKDDGGVRRWQDWAPIAGSTATDVDGNDGRTSESPTDSQFGLRPRFLDFEEEDSSTMSLPDEHLEYIVDVSEEIVDLEKAGMSTLSGDNGTILQIQPQFDNTNWWIMSDAVTYAKPPGGVQATTAGRLSVKQPPTPSTHNSNHTSGRFEEDDRKCFGFLRRAFQHALFRRVVIVAVFLLVLFVALSATAMIKSKTFRGAKSSETQAASTSTPQSETNPTPPPFSYASPVAPGAEPVDDPARDTNPPTEAPSIVIPPGPYRTPVPTSTAPNVLPPAILPDLSPTDVPHQDITTEVPSTSPSLLDSAIPTVVPPPSNPPGDSTTQAFTVVAGIILAKSPDSIESLGEQSSPQFEALQWMAADVSQRPLPDDRILQRWVLAVLFYSTRGSGWAHSDDWLTAVSECFWFTTSEVDICDEEGRIISVELRDNGLEGTLPGELSLLSDSLGKTMSGVYC
jgi:hypothetical protein